MKRAKCVGASRTGRVIAYNFRALFNFSSSLIFRRGTPAWRRPRRRRNAILILASSSLRCFQVIKLKLRPTLGGIRFHEFVVVLDLRCARFNDPSSPLCSVRPFLKELDHKFQAWTSSNFRLLANEGRCERHS